MRKKEVGTDDVTRTKTRKEKINCEPRDMILQFLNDVLPSYMVHKAVDYHQKNFIKDLKKSLTVNDLLLHIDFAENFNCKYSSEIQCIHFCGNRDSVTLHTGVKYHGQAVQSFCTITKDLNHDPVGIWHHLKPILEEYAHCEEPIKSLYFLSDSPNTQYRCKYMFYIYKNKIIPIFEHLERSTWNFSQSAHGKSAADGVGASLKRTCNDHIAHGNDVSNFDEFYACVREKIHGIQIIPIESTEDPQLRREVKENSPEVKDRVYLFFGKFLDHTLPKLYIFFVFYRFNESPPNYMDTIRPTFLILQYALLFRLLRSMLAFSS